MKSRTTPIITPAPTKRGRPTITDSNRRRCGMTILFTPAIHKQIVNLAKLHNQNLSAMARILIEKGMAG